MRMRFLIALVLLALGGASLWYVSAAEGGSDQTPQPLWPLIPLELKTDTSSYDLSVKHVLSMDDMSKGLMFIEKMPENQGMLFDYRTAYRYGEVPQLWMKNTLIPLDMLFIAEDGNIKHIIHWAEPETLTVRSAGVAVPFVLEINGGVAEKNGIHVGDKVVGLPSSR